MSLRDVLHVFIAYSREVNLTLIDTWQSHALIRDPAGCFKLRNHAGVSPITAGTISVNPSTALRMVCHTLRYFQI